MPSQSWDGSWSCDFCGMPGFRCAEDAAEHQREECQQPNRKRLRPASPQNVSNGMDSVPRTNEILRHNAAYSPQSMRQILLLGPQESHAMAQADATACQNMELFEATQEHMSERDASGSSVIVPGLVGIRCIHCVRTPLSAMGKRWVFPHSVFAVGSGVRAVAERHMLQCPLVPRHVQETIERTVAAKRLGHLDDEERRRKALLDHCTMLCQQVGIVDRYPPDSGIVFLDGNRRTGPIETNSFDPVAFPESRAGLEVSPIAETSFIDDPNQHHQRREGRIATDRFAMEGRRESYPSPNESVPQFGPVHGGPPPGFPGYPAYSGPPPMQMPMQPQPGYPFYQAPDGSWECRYCSMIHPHHRDQGSIWKATNPPHGDFIDSHMAVCRFYNESIQGSIQPPFPGIGHPGQPMPHDYAYGGPSLPQHQQSPYGAPLSPTRGQPPPGWTSSPGPTVHQSPYHVPQPQAVHAFMSPVSPHYPAFHHGQDAVAMANPLHHEDLLPHGVLSPASTSMAASSDHVARQAIDYLTSINPPPTHDATNSHGQAVEEELVLEEDRMLLTDYFYHIMKQLGVCRFTEADRKTRGGKRENIAVGYGGLQCIHCANAPNARKFYWSNVDRLANSFAEIPGHILKCRRCPVQTKGALRELKTRHADQMSRLPRGSQKVFFRRMWRRLHDKDPLPTGIALEQGAAEETGHPVSVTTTTQGTFQPTDTNSSSQGLSPSTSGEESAFLIERSTEEAAKALALSVSSTASSPPSPSSRILLAIAEDKEWLSDMDCFVRRTLEVFCATVDDVDVNREERKYPIQQGQVGIRCIHCAIANGRRGVRGSALRFPYSIGNIYESVREFQRLHLETCPNLPQEQKTKLQSLKGTSSLTSVLRKYYVLAAKALGMFDTPDGIRSGAEAVPLGSSAAFAFSPQSDSKVSTGMRNSNDGSPLMAMQITKSPQDVAPTPHERPSSAESNTSVKIE